MLFLKGYIHFPIVKCPDTGIKLRIAFFDSAQLFSKEYQFAAEDVREKEFEISFDSPIRIEPGKKYDISSTVMCEYFQGHYGQNPKISPDLLTISKSSKDNNSTSLTSGQFKAFLFFKKI